MAIVIDVHSLSESSWIEATYPAQLDQAVGPADNFTVRFSKAIATSSLTVDHFIIFDGLSGQELEGAFRDIVLHNDYDNVLLSLTLHLSQALEPDRDYVFQIDGIYDAAGNDQDKPHAVSFRTEDVTAVVPPEVTENSVISVIDKSIANAGIGLVEEEVGGEDAGAHTAYMDPTDGAYNVSAATDTLYVNFSPNEITEASAAVTRRQISRLETPWEVVGVTTEIDPITTLGKLEITLPAVSTDVYLEPGYEYKIEAHATEKVVAGVTSSIDETFTFNVMGPLSPMFASVSSVLLLYPGWSSYDVARLIYINTATAIVLDPRQADSTTRAGENYVLYSTLWQLSLIGTTEGSMIMLGDLQVQYEKGSGGLSGKWEELMNQAEAKLVKVNPAFARKGAAYASRFAARDWDEGGTTKRRIDLRN